MRGLRGNGMRGAGPAQLALRSQPWFGGEQREPILGGAVFRGGRADAQPPQRRGGLRHLTRLGPLPEFSPAATREDIRAAIDRRVSEAMADLKRGRLECLVLDDAAHLTACGRAIWERLVELLEDGSVLGLGVSVRCPAEALAALETGDIHYLELPFNLLDWRWRECGVVAALNRHPGITVQARDPWLQGLLLTPPEAWPGLAGVDAHAIISRVEELASAFGRASVADLCLAFVRGQDWIDAVELGGDAPQTAAEAFRVALQPPLGTEEAAEVVRHLPRVPEQALDPACWAAASRA